MHDEFDWTALQSFLAVVRAGRLTLAARQLGVDHSTLSRRILYLEKLFRNQLFHRSSLGYHLTAQGEELMQFAQSMEDVAIRAVTQLGNSGTQTSGTVRVGAPEGLGTVFVAARLARLSQRYPDIQIQLLTMPRSYSLSKREADIVIGFSAPEEDRFYGRKLADYEWGLYASAGYLRSQAPIRAKADLRNHRFIGYIEDLLYAPELNFFADFPGEIHATVTSSNIIAQMNMTMEGSGLCMLPIFMITPQTGLERVLPEEVSFTRSFYLIVHSDIRNVPRIRTVSDFLADEIQASAALFFSKDRKPG